MRETDDYYFFWKHQFGQWTLRNMVDVDGIEYNCCEQFMMYKKAILFGDKAIAQQLLAEKDPSAQQKMGRLIRGFKAELWDKHKLGIVWYGNYLKFTQHPDLQERLLQTGDKILAEASPYDLIWGVGLGAKDDNILDSANWRGQNLLGKTLMSLRALLAVTAKDTGL
ncbi:MAG: NADAR family protein [Lewinella sp.]|jgi:ribA/ribD-fused uncharacterized protein|uniref:NADAR family protein n=1 Tax=Lewinella sp. TaxID=2004506 RepID=UPI003D6AD837